MAINAYAWTARAWVFTFPAYCSLAEQPPIVGEIAASLRQITEFIFTLTRCCSENVGCVSSAQWQVRTMADHSSEPPNQGTAWAALMARLAEDLTAAGQSADEQSVAGAYQLLHRKLTEYFQARLDLVKFREDSTALADTVIDRLAHQVQREKEIPHLRSYAYGIAKLVYKERIRRGHAQDQAIPETGTNWSALDELIQQETETRQNDCFQTCLQRLTPAKQAMLLRYFQTDDTQPPKREREALAREFGLSAAQLRLQVHRLKEQFKKCLKLCLGRSLSDET